MNWKRRRSHVGRQLNPDITNLQLGARRLTYPLEEYEANGATIVHRHEHGLVSTRLVLPNRLHVLRVELGVRLLERPVVDPDGFGFDRLVG